MCGIAGMFSTSEDAVSPVTIDYLSAGIKNRGPDNQKTKVYNSNLCTVTLLHSRLSIIDLTPSSDQPMEHPQSPWIIVYNGEIYNYLELRQELIGLGWKFYTRSDTEVLLAAWSQWKIESLNKLNGDFAFAAFNKDTSDIFLLRDRFGVKPLFWGKDGVGSIIFSSSLSSLAKTLRSDINQEYCASALSYAVYEDGSDASPYSAINSIPPGSGCHFYTTGKSINQEFFQWYNLRNSVDQKITELLSLPDQHLLELTYNTLQSAVNLRLRSDVPLATSLSGGLDSTTITSLARINCDSIQAFSYGNPDFPKSEGPIVDKFCLNKNLPIEYIWPSDSSQNLQKALCTTLQMQEAPFGGISVIAQNIVYQQVRELGYKVVLGGQGGDEIFAGYRKFFIVAINNAIRRKDAPEALSVALSFCRVIINELYQFRVYLNALKRYTNKSNTPSSGLFIFPKSHHSLLGGSSTSLTHRQIDDVQKFSLPTLLRYEDRNSMGHGIESRLPFLDYRLVEIAIALPARLKIRDGYGKWALRKIMEHEVPDFIRLARTKRGFDVTQNWVANGLGHEIRQRLNEGRHDLSPYIRKNADFDKLFSDDLLIRDSNTMREALLGCWIAQPL